MYTYIHSIYTLHIYIYTGVSYVYITSYHTGLQSQAQGAAHPLPQRRLGGRHRGRGGGHGADAQADFMVDLCELMVDIWMNLWESMVNCGGYVVDFICGEDLW